MPYYTQAYTNYDYNNYNRYPYHQSYNNYNHHNRGNGYTAMNYANRWYPGWNAYYYQWKNNCWWVYMRYGNHYRTVYISPQYNWHHYQNGYWW